MKAGDPLLLQIEKGVYRGRGLAREGGRVVLVTGALPGDRVRARAVKVKRDWAEAELLAVVEPGPGRRAPGCVHAPRCGGCAYQALEYDAQLALKRAVLVESLARAQVPLEAVPVDTLGSPERGWRWRARVHVAWHDGRPALGFREAGTHALVDVDACPQLTPALAALYSALRSALAADPQGLAGVAEARLAEGGDGRSLVAALGGHGPLAAPVARRLVARLPALTGLGWIGDEARAPFVSLAGAPHVFTPRPEGLLRSHVLAFFQGNRERIDALVAAATLPLRGARRVLELYSGVGLFTLPLAARAEHVRAVEGAAWAAADARHNLAARGQVRLVEGAVEGDLPHWAGERFDAALLDPPRAGAGPAVVDALARSSVGRVVYVSCDPTTLARDVARLRQHGFGLRALSLLDLFPDTFHLEAVATLER